MTWVDTLKVTCKSPTVDVFCKITTTSIIIVFQEQF